jgi:DNA-binding NarL/FixJ family response regulator
VLILDYKLPGMTGIELYEQVKNQLSSKVKVIMMSATDDGNLVLDFIKKGVRDYVVKDEKVIKTLTSIIEGEDDIYFDD